MNDSKGNKLTTLKESWDDLSESFPKDMPATVRGTLRQAFFTGAWAFNELQIAIVESKENTRERLVVLSNEAQASIEPLPTKGHH